MHTYQSTRSILYRLWQITGINKCGLKQNFIHPASIYSTWANKHLCCQIHAKRYVNLKWIYLHICTNILSIPTLVLRPNLPMPNCHKLAVFFLFFFFWMITESFGECGVFCVGELSWRPLFPSCNGRRWGVPLVTMLMIKNASGKANFVAWCECPWLWWEKYLTVFSSAVLTRLTKSTIFPWNLWRWVYLSFVILLLGLDGYSKVCKWISDL